MKVITRRDFLKISGVTAAGLTLSQLGFDLTPVQAYAAELEDQRMPRKHLLFAVFAQLDAAFSLPLTKRER